ncbi:MAG: exodeoxyribonuclease VII small subunit [Prevotella sp.]|jgi:exodeoxyribonuclease VII small subunit|nr:exodeoxyribonuclease VII small subunit [Prevotella sp.]MBQ9670838.1 exodeoxyribonuclease VII small subunit [Prevotella sp.]MDY6229779.1 exodeoxyribonuclease VII small subunit [Prevotella sp.]
MKEEMKYEEAMQRLETIVSQIENDELGIDELTARLKEAKQMLKTCRDKLTKTDKEIRKLLDKE